MDGSHRGTEDLQGWRVGSGLSQRWEAREFSADGRGAAYSKMLGEHRRGCSAMSIPSARARDKIFFRYSAMPRSGAEKELAHSGWMAHTEAQRICRAGAWGVVSHSVGRRGSFLQMGVAQHILRCWASIAEDVLR